MKKLFTQEVKIGLAFIAAIAVGYFGINYLKGISILHLRTIIMQYSIT